MKNHTIYFPWDIQKRSAECYVRAIIKEFELPLPLKINLVSPSKEYILEIEQ